MQANDREETVEEIEAVNGVNVAVTLQCSHTLEPGAISPILIQNMFTDAGLDGLVEEICSERPQPLATWRTCEL